MVGLKVYIKVYIQVYSKVYIQGYIKVYIGVILGSWKVKWKLLFRVSGSGQGLDSAGLAGRMPQEKLESGGLRKFTYTPPNAIEPGKLL